MLTSSGSNAVVSGAEPVELRETVEVCVDDDDTDVNVVEEEVVDVSVVELEVTVDEVVDDVEIVDDETVVPVIVLDDTVVDEMVDDVIVVPLVVVELTCATDVASLPTT
eukprot:m.294403 g.294403  ORF g.294403 m.294403 type:complete len:109 (+) comp20033_c1_seq5:415-741(+)